MSIRAFLLAMLCAPCLAQEQLQINEAIWRNLSQQERNSLQSRFIVMPISPLAFGVIIDNQGADESTPANNAGSALGRAAANASYIDHAIKSGNYSAKNQLAAGVLGAALGSTLNQPAQGRFHFRYSVKHLDGEITYHDIIQGDSFRHPLGVCVSTPVISKIPQEICNESIETFRGKYLQPLINEQLERDTSSPLMKVDSPSIECNVKNLPKFKTTLKKCNQIGGAASE